MFWLDEPMPKIPWVAETQATARYALALRQINFTAVGAKARLSISSLVHLDIYYYTVYYMLIEGAYLSLIHTFVAKFTGIYETSSWSNALVKSRCVCVIQLHTIVLYILNYSTIAACFYSTTHTLWIYILYVYTSSSLLTIPVPVGVFVLSRKQR